MSVTTTETTTSTTLTYTKKLEGVELTEELLRLWKDCYSQVQFDDGRLSKSKSKGGVQGGASQKEAAKIVKERENPNTDPQWLPIDVVRAMQVLLDGDSSSSLEEALQKTSLVFTPAPTASDAESREQRRFQRRMGKLRLQYEETKYVKLTNNLSSGIQDDDITGKSMTYAASVGLNMIVAPISFGCFMYFFAGGVMDYFLGESFAARTTGGMDIKRVIVGVVSGVVMLFIEMILFVIRTHEFELHQLKKKKKKGVQPFGAYTAKSKKTVVVDSSASSKPKEALVKKED
jgi:hypothetical protein